MSDDTISRWEAIKTALRAISDLQGKDNLRDEYIISEMEEIPSAKIERPCEIQDILDYLDTVLHPIISPEHWNVYSELYDVISTLPSAERHGRWEQVGDNTYRCSVCGEISCCNSPFCSECGASMMDEVGE